METTITMTLKEMMMTTEKKTKLMKVLLTVTMISPMILSKRMQVQRNHQGKRVQENKKKRTRKVTKMRILSHLKSTRFWLTAKLSFRKDKFLHNVKLLPDLS